MRFVFPDALGPMAAITLFRRTPLGLRKEKVFSGAEGGRRKAEIDFRPMITLVDAEGIKISEADGVDHGIVSTVLFCWSAEKAGMVGMHDTNAGIL